MSERRLPKFEAFEALDAPPEKFITPKANDGAFWLVWNPDGAASRRVHRTKDSAEAECIRLAEANPDQIFFVLEPVKAIRTRKPPVETVPLSEAFQYVEGPF